MKREKEDRVVRKDDSKVVFSIRGLYSLLETGCAIPFSFKDCLELMDSYKGKFLHLGLG